MKLALAAGTTSQIVHVFLEDSTVTTGAGKTGLAFGDITAYYVRAGGTLTAMTMEAIATLGTWNVSGDNALGFKLVHDANAPGLYELHLPDNILAPSISGNIVSSVTILLQAAGTKPFPLEIQLGNMPVAQGTVAVAAPIRHSSTSNILRLYIADNNGEPKMDLAYDTSGLLIIVRRDNEVSGLQYYANDGTIEAIASPGTYQAPTAGKCRFGYPGPVGWHELHLSDSVFALAGAKALTVTVCSTTGSWWQSSLEVPLVTYDPLSGVAPLNLIMEPSVEQ